MDVSVIIPVYNAEPFVKKAVCSAVNLQEVKEIIRVEDASSDHSLAVCEKLVEIFPKVNLFRHPDLKNHGASASRNLGIEKANYTYIAFLDADDFFLSDRFQKDKITFEKNTEIDGVYNAVGVYYYSEEAKKIYKQTTGTLDIITLSEEIPSDELFIDLLKGNKGFIHLNGLTLKKSSLDMSALKFDEELRLTQDTDFVLRAILKMKLKPSNIIASVAIRGIHEGNRCVDIAATWSAAQVLYHKLEGELFYDKRRKKEYIYVKKLTDAYLIHSQPNFSKRLISILFFFLRYPSALRQTTIRNTALKTFLGLGTVGKLFTALKRKQFFT